MEPNNIALCFNNLRVSCKVSCKVEEFQPLDRVGLLGEGGDHEETIQRNKGKASLKKGLFMAEISLSDKTSIPLAGPSAPQITRYWACSGAIRAGNKSLVSLAAEVQRGDRREGIVWLVLGLSAAALMVLSFG
jgi:hypothetical protein